MKIQSLSICVPAGCLNDCEFCVSKMQRHVYKNQIEENLRFRDLYKKDYKKRLLFARDNGCNTVILTGDGEPLLNKGFLEDFGEWNNSLPSPFRWIELQTSGTLLDNEYLRFLRNSVGVNTISLSLSDMFDSHNNAKINRTKDGSKVDIEHVCDEIVRYDFNLRLSLNMTSAYSDKSPRDIFKKAEMLGANQVTFRVLYNSKNNDTDQDKWIQKNRCDIKKMNEIIGYIKEEGAPLEILPFGATRYSVHGMSVVVDGDCMSQEVGNTLKYLILRPNCKLYSRWEDKGSLVF